MENNEEKTSKKNKGLIILLSIIAVIIGIVYYLNSLRYETTDDAYIDGDLVQISAKVSGQVEDIYIQDNQKIKEGDIIAKIDDTDYKVKYE